MQLLGSLSFDKNKKTQQQTRYKINYDGKCGVKANITSETLIAIDVAKGKGKQKKYQFVDR